MKKSLLFFTFFFSPLVLIAKSYDEAAQEDPKAFSEVQRFAQAGNFKRSVISNVAQGKGDSVRTCIENMSCENLALLITTPTHEGKQVQELFEQYPFFKQLFEEQEKRCNCCKEATISQPANPKPFAAKKRAIPAKYSSIIKLCNSTFCTQKQNEQDEIILKKIAQKNNRHARFKSNLKYLMICASPF